MNIKSIHTLGREAYVEGKPLEDNPYEEGTEEYCHWYNGWYYEMEAKEQKSKA